MKRFIVPTFMLLAFAMASAALAKPAYFIQADVVRGAVGAQGAVCVANGVFLLGEEIVWRSYVYDASTGELLTQDQIDSLGITVTATIVDSGVTAAMHYGPHPAPDAPNADFFWAGPFSIPADFPTGQYQWTIVVKDNAGNEAVYQPMGHAAGLGAITITQPATASAR